MTALTPLPRFALVGSGEFLPVMAPVDRALLAERDFSVAVIPTASAPDGEERFQYWFDLARAHYASMGVEVREIDVRNREEAIAFKDDEAISTAGLVYLSGGNPGYLASALRGTPVWRAISDAAMNGAAIAGCSAGAMAMTTLAPMVREPEAEMGPGLSLLNNVAVIPHFDKIQGWIPGIVDSYLAALPVGVTLVGIDEETALVGGPNAWRVEGNKSVHLIRSHTDSTVHESGAIIDIL